MHQAWPLSVYISIFLVLLVENWRPAALYFMLWFKPFQKFITSWTLHLYSRPSLSLYISSIDGDTGLYTVFCPRPHPQPVKCHLPSLSYLHYLVKIKSSNIKILQTSLTHSNQHGDPILGCEPEVKNHCFMLSFLTHSQISLYSAFNGSMYKLTVPYLWAGKNRIVG
jgi:hypothetical protein